MSVTLTGNNNYSGSYDDVTVVGIGNTVSDSDGDQVWLFGRLQVGSTKYSSGDFSGGTFNTTATGSAGDTAVFSFHVSEGSTETFTGWLIDHGFGADVANGQVADGTPESTFASQYTAWLQHIVDTYHIGVDTDLDGHIDVAPGQNDPNGTPVIEGMTPTQVQALFSNPDEVTVQTGSNTHERFYDNTFSTGAGGITADHGGNDIILGFGVGSDHISLNGDSQISWDVFTANFNVASTTHTSANNNTVHDTTISFGNTWSVDLYGVDTTALTTEASLQQYAWDNIVAHA